MGDALQLLVRMDRLFAAGDLDGWLRCFDDDVVYRNFNEGAARGEWVGKEAALAALLGGASGGYGDAGYDLRVTGYRGIGSDLAAMDWTLTLTPPGAEPATARGCQLFRVRDDRVVEVFEISAHQARELSGHLTWEPEHPPSTRFAPPVA